MNYSKKRVSRLLLIILVVSLATSIIPVQATGRSTPVKPRIKVERVSKDILRFEEYLPLNIDPEFFAQYGMDPLPSKSYYRVNVYGIDVGEGVILIDVGDEILAEKLYNLVERRFKKEIIAVYLTHGHADHAGAGLYFQDQGVPVYASSIDAMTIIVNGANDPSSPIPDEFTYEGYDVDGYLDYIPLSEGFSAIPSSGHTIGSMSIAYEDDYNTYLFTSDALLPDQSQVRNRQDQTYVLSYFTLINNQMISQIPGYPDFIGMQLGSIEYIDLIATDIDVLCPGHLKQVKSRYIDEYIEMSVYTISALL